jgi:ABC-type lipopolysaccharide export system ATPase subunit
MDKAVVINNLTKKYGDFTAVKNLTLDVEKGEIFGKEHHHKSMFRPSFQNRR